MKEALDKSSNFILQSGDIEVKISRLGGAIESLKIKGRENVWRDVCLHFDSPIERIKSDTYAGAVIGRVSNRIAGGKFSLGGRTYFLSRNDGENTLHGGKDGFDRRCFEVDPSSKESYLSMMICSNDGDQGFPGKLIMRVEFMVSIMSLEVHFTAISDEDTVWAPTLHPYFCLGDEDTIDETYLQIYADAYTPMDNHQIPTGEIRSVGGTPFDFRKLKKIGADIGNEALIPTNGYDHNFVLRDDHAATAYNEKSGITMDIYTDMPGLHFYSGNFLKGNVGTHELSPREGFALEPQFFPNAANVPSFLQPVLKKGTVQSHYIRYVFGIMTAEANQK